MAVVARNRPINSVKAVRDPAGQLHVELLNLSGRITTNQPEHIYILNTPNDVGGAASLVATRKLSPSTFLVSAGSMMPSSHRRELE